MPELSTASLPDIVFILLFFFMVITVIRKDNPPVKAQVPLASQIESLSKKVIILDLYIGYPKNKDLGKEPRIFAEGRFWEAQEIPQLIEEARSGATVEDGLKLITNLKVDRGVKMGLVNDVKKSLRQVGARKINYQSIPGNDSPI
ncbi:MAG: biopolymer transporter ExbD [Bacteroidota bacterium]